MYTIRKPPGIENWILKQLHIMVTETVALNKTYFCRISSSTATDCFVHCILTKIDLGQQDSLFW